jgi:hypothetical protein
VLPNLCPVGKPTIYGGDMKKMFIIEWEVKAMSFLTGFTRRFFSVVNLTLLCDDNQGCHSRESGNPVEKTGFRIKSGMTFPVK